MERTLQAGKIKGKVKIITLALRHSELLTFSLFVIMCLFAFMLNGCVKDGGFMLTGKTRGVQDGTKVYLLTALEDSILDATEIVNNAFQFRTKLQHTPVKVVLKIADGSQYRRLWIENRPITIDASKSSFRDAIVIGSRLEKDSQDLHHKVDTLRKKERIDQLKLFIQNNPDNLLSGEILSEVFMILGKQETKRLYNTLSKKNKNSEYGTRVLKYLTLNQSPKVGDFYVDFEMNDTSGKKRRPSDFKHKVILLDFWASWCAPCRDKHPSLLKTYLAYRHKGFEIFAVSLDQKKRNWEKAIKQDSLIWTHVNDLGGGTANKASLIYGVNTIPDNFLLDLNGKIIARGIRGEGLREKLDELLN